MLTLQTKCNDGTTSNATGQGACSHHGGVYSYDEIGDSSVVWIVIGSIAALIFLCGAIYYLSKLILLKRAAYERQKFAHSDIFLQGVLPEEKFLKIYNHVDLARNEKRIVIILKNKESQEKRTLYLPKNCQWQESNLKHGNRKYIRFGDLLGTVKYLKND